MPQKTFSVNLWSGKRLDASNNEQSKIVKVNVGDGGIVSAQLMGTVTINCGTSRAIVKVNPLEIFNEYTIFRGGTFDINEDVSYLLYEGDNVFTIRVSGNGSYPYCATFTLTLTYVIEYETVPPDPPPPPVPPPDGNGEFDWIQSLIKSLPLIVGAVLFISILQYIPKPRRS